jgi:putative FmdB family regulatory protein
MPIYEYRCSDCGQVSEFIVLGAEDGLACKACSSPKLEKLMSAHNTIGSGSSGSFAASPSGCCGAPNSCGTPGSCCSG